MEMCGSLAMPESRGMWSVGSSTCSATHPSTEISDWSLSVADKHEKAHWHLSVWCTHGVFLGCSVTGRREGRAARRTAAEVERVRPTKAKFSKRL